MRVRVCVRMRVCVWLCVGKGVKDKNVAMVPMGGGGGASKEVDRQRNPVLLPKPTNGSAVAPAPSTPRSGEAREAAGDGEESSPPKVERPEDMRQMMGIISMEDLIECMLGTQILDESDSATVRACALRACPRACLPACLPASLPPCLLACPPSGRRWCYACGATLGTR